MAKLNAKGFAHTVLLLAAVVVLVVGGIGSYIYLRQSDAATSTTSRTTSDPDAYLCKKSRNKQPSGHYSLVWKGKLYAKINGHKKAGPGIWKLYAGKGYWCAITIASTTTYNDAHKPMAIKLTTDYWQSGSNLVENPNQPTQVAKQSGQFKYYAGPVYTKFHWMEGADPYAPYKFSTSMKYKGITYTGIRTSGASKSSNSSGFYVEQDPQRDY